MVDQLLTFTLLLFSR